MELFLALTLILLVAGVVGSFIPMVPGALISLAATTLYWWSTGFSSPGPVTLLLMYGTALTALIFDVFAGAIGSKAGGASHKTVQMAAIAGVLFFFIAGPVGTILGIAGVVLAREYLRTGEKVPSFKAAAYTVASVLGSAIVQGAMTALTLLIFLIYIAL